VQPRQSGESALRSIHDFNVARAVREHLGGGKVALGLLYGVHRWAKAQRAQQVTLHVSSGMDLKWPHKLARRLGYEFSGGTTRFVTEPRML
jgi:hypothetical protein